MIIDYNYHVMIGHITGTLDNTDYTNYTTINITTHIFINHITITPTGTTWRNNSKITALISTNTTKE